MRTYLMEWETGTISILTAESELDLYEQLDEEGDPSAGVIYKLPLKFHVSSSLFEGKLEVFDEVENSTGFKSKWKKFNFKDGIFAKYIGVDEKANPEGVQKAKEFLGNK